jgi:RNA polymerase sigma-B factor
MVPDVVQSARPRSRYEVDALHARYSSGGAPEDREALVEQYLPLARHLARKYVAPGERDDLEQVASLGLLKALDRFDPDRGIAFTTYAIPTILGEIKRYFRDLGWTVRVPRSLQELAVEVRDTDERLARELGRSPTVAEIAEHCNESVERVVEARGTASAHRPDSLDQPRPEEDDFRETLGDDDVGFAQAELSADLEALLDCLSERERAVLHLRFHEDLRQREIAAQLGLSQMHISRLLRAAIAKLQEQAHKGEAWNSVMA